MGVASVSAACCLLSPSAWAARVERIDGVTVVHLEGSPYEIGRQHGEALRHEVRDGVANVLRYFRSYLKIPLIRSLAVNWWLDVAWHEALPHIPKDYLEELRGLADGSGVPLQELYRLHALPDRTYSCSSFAAWGQATAGGRMIHLRNLDWNMGAGIQRYAVVFVVHPQGKHAFVNVGWAGFIGVLSGVNDAQISVAQIGAETTDATFRGEPMTFLMRRVLEDAGDADQAAAVIRSARRTVGVNYVFADAKIPRGIVIETTHHYVRIFTANDPTEQHVSYARPIPDAVFRADPAMDPEIRDRQLASHGDPAQPGLENPTGSSAYDVRYLGMAAGITARYGRLDTAAAREIARAVGPASNVQSIIFAWPEVWVANAQGRMRASQSPYHRLDAAELLQHPASQ